MAKLSLWFDPSASMSKGIYRIDSSSPQFMMMESAYLPVDTSSIDAYLTQKMGGGYGKIAPEREAWVNIGGNYFVVGELAKQEFEACDHLRYLKHETSIPKIVAMVGAIALKNKMPTEFEIDIGVLIPYGEKRDAQLFKSDLIEALSVFRCRGSRYKVTTDNYAASPEGYGVLCEGSIVNPLESKILVLMLGYRNTSYILSDKGKINGETTHLGFSRMLENVVHLTSGYKAEDLVASVYRSGLKVKEKPLLSILRKTSESARETELKTLLDALRKAQLSYLNRVTQWLESRKFPAVEEVIIAGGTGRYYGKALERKVKGLTAFLVKSPKISWASSLEDELKILLTQNQQQEYEYRLTDLYGYYKFLEKAWSLTAEGGNLHVSA